MFESTPLVPSVLAFVTTIHLAMVVLRTHRSPTAGVFSFVTPVSLTFAAAPWLLSSAVGVAVGLITHVAWFAACERLLPGVPAQRRSDAPAGAMRQPTPVVRATPPRAPAKPAAAPRAAGFLQVPVMAVFDETPDIRTFRFARPDGFEFKAGQFLTVRVRSDDRDHVRCYSISSSPGALGHMEISVKRIGSVSGTLHAMLRPGSLLSVRPPAGSFVYPSGDDRPIVLIAGGVGITPLMAMLRHGVDSEPSRPITLFYSVRTPTDIAFHDEIRLLDRRHGQFRAFIAVTDAEPTGAEHFPGRINEDLIVRTMPGIVHAMCMVCGPPQMIEAMTAMLQSLGVPSSQIRFEVFQPAIAAGAGAPVREESSPAASEDGFEVSFARTRRSGRVQSGQTLLVALSCGSLRHLPYASARRCHGLPLDDARG
jgi:ferredoxin-NADP reductase